MDRSRLSIARIAEAWVITWTTVWTVPTAIFLSKLIVAHHALGIFTFLMASACALFVLRAPTSGDRCTQAWEANGAVYETIGVDLFGRIVLHGRYFNAVLRRRGIATRRRASKTMLKDLDTAARMSEQIHMTGAFASLPVVMAAAFVRQPVWVAVLVAMNVLLNVYPILLQRRLRARLHVLLERG